VLSGLIVGAIALRTTLYPLSGYDTYFRWEALARAMMSYESLSYYPPVTSSDYSKYFYAEGIPPLVSTVYWWLYAVIGKPVEQVTSISVVLQLSSIMALTFYGTRQAFNSRAACFSLITLLTTTLFINGVAIGQETGFTALSVAGQLCFALAAVRTPRPSLVIAAALFAALGSLSRDYGPALAISGFTVLAWHPASRRFLALFTVIAAGLSAPWYVRSWFITGNPFYSHAIPGGFPVNEIHSAIIESYRSVFSFGQLSASEWADLALVIITGATPIIIVGLPLCITRLRGFAPFLLTAVAVVLLWIVSVPQTAGGIIYSLRMLTPAFVALSISTGAAMDHLLKTGSNRLLLITSETVLVLLALGSITFTLSHPFGPQDIGTAITSRYTGAPGFSIRPEIASYLAASDMHSTGVLTDNQYLAVYMQRNTRFRPVMIWSPEVKFVFDRSLAPNEVRRRLIAGGIRIVSIDNNSLSTLTLEKFPFYQEDILNWKPLITLTEQASLYWLTP